MEYTDRIVTVNDVEDKDMAITASMVKELREQTGAGMMDCKKALTETDGDFEKAIEFLREKGLATAQKKAGRIAAEGIVSTTIKDGDKVAAIVEVNAETDFVAKNEVFRNYVKEVVEQAADTEAADIEAFKAEPWALDTSMTVADKLAAMIAKIGENMNIRRFEKVVSEDGVVVSYIHAGGKIGVLVNLEVEGEVTDKILEMGKDVAMQIAALNPRFWDKSQVTEDVLAEEKRIMLAQMDNDPKMAGKPAQVKEKIVEGKLNKFYAENCLLQQDFVKDGDMTVEKYMASVAKAAGASVRLLNAVRFEKGEGIEKKQENFADEIASMIK